jgi:hypothetical protein
MLQVIDFPFISKVVYCKTPVQATFAKTRPESNDPTDRSLSSQKLAKNPRCRRSIHDRRQRKLPGFTLRKCLGTRQRRDIKKDMFPLVVHAYSCLTNRGVLFFLLR